MNIAEKIRKLLALAGSPNEHEALLAMEKAQELIAQHKVDMSEVLTDRPDPGDKLDCVTVTATRGATRVVGWRWTVIDGLCKSLGCRPIFSSGEGFQAVGKLNDLVLLDDLLTWICSQIERMAKESGFSGKDYLDSFKKGCARTVSERLTANIKRLTTTNEKYGALMVVTNQLVDAEFTRRFPRTVNRSGGVGARKGTAYQSGKVAGHNVSLTSSRKLTHG